MPGADAPQLVRIDPGQPDGRLLERAAAVIRGGGLVAFPTETVYGLGANALDPDAVQRIFDAKRRALTDPLIVHLESAAQLDLVARDVPEAVRLLTERFWPGPLTVVLPKQERVPANVTAGLDTVAVRVPRHAVARGLIRAAGVPIAAPSANLFTRTSATTAAHVLEDLGDRVDLILDGGPTELGIESTVVAVEGQRLRVLRPGAAPVEEIVDHLAAHQIPATLVFGAGPPAGPAAGGAGATASTPGAEHAPAASPGMMSRHYSPRARLLFFSGPAGEAIAAMRRAADEEVAAGRRLGLLLCREDAPRFDGLPAGVQIEDLGSCADLPAIAHRLFAAMRRLDARGVDTICVRSVPSRGIGLAIVDRLTRAADGRVLGPGDPTDG